jgi:hypothetical protein
MGRCFICFFTAYFFDSVVKVDGVLECDSNQERRRLKSPDEITN